MKTITKEQKIEGYKYALKILNKKLYPRFTCVLLNDYLYKLGFRFLLLGEAMKKIKDLFPEYFKYAPEDWDGIESFFKGAGQNEKRIKIIKEILENLK